MTRKSNMIALAAGMVFVTTAGFFVTSAGASTSNVLDCRTNTRSAVIDCCQQIVRKKRPIWMMNTGASCSTAASCSSKTVKSSAITHVEKPKKVLVCSIHRVDPNKPDKPDKPDRPDPNDNPDPNGNPDPETPNRPDPIG